ncbi:YdcF family protein [Nocardia seriolae]|uniref:YdcF family protein n=1 Tax=Nocardia seriolae TaxID=37332 RepID=UPI0012BB595B|nr:YdcF family protein [Nocardia seriolae]MTL12755.1 YdcF family protein [Nocardia seriolae]
MLDAGRHRKITSSGQWQGVRPELRRRSPGRHHRPIPNTIRIRTLQALLPGATVIALATGAAPAFADPAPAYLDPAPISAVPLAAEADSTTPAAEPVAGQVPDRVDPLAGLSSDVLASIDAFSTLNFPGVDLPGVNLPALFTPDTAIVVLGYGLLPDGQMRPELMSRLYAGYVSALLSPRAPVIVTGGNPQNGVTEADAMADWLVEHGIDRDRIHTETKANSTVQNAAFSAQLMDVIGAHAAILITSADHIARALTNFQAAGISVVATMTPDAAPLSAVPFGPHA